MHFGHSHLAHNCDHLRHPTVTKPQFVTLFPETGVYFRFLTKKRPLWTMGLFNNCKVCSMTAVEKCCKIESVTWWTAWQLARLMTIIPSSIIVLSQGLLVTQHKMGQMYSALPEKIEQPRFVAWDLECLFLVHAVVKQVLSINQADWWSSKTPLILICLGNECA